MLNTFIEAWVAELFPEMEQVPYPIGNDKLILINNTDADTIRVKLSTFNPFTIYSTVEGAKILVSSLWVDLALLDAASTAEAKRLDSYQVLLRDSCLVTMSLADRRSALLNPPEPEPEPEPKPISVEKPFELFSNKFLTFGNNEAFIDNVNSVFYDAHIELLNFSRRIGKPVILLTSRANIIINRTFFNNALKIVVINDMISGFSKTVTMNMMCLGLKISGLYLPTPKEQSKSPYADYDNILKDNFNNIIFAVGKDNNVIITIYDPSVNHVKEVCIRYGVDQDFADRDIELYREYLLENKKNYIRVAKDSSEQVIKELKMKSATLLTEYQDALVVALEKAKLFNTINNQIEYFNQEKFNKDQNEKFDTNYQMTCNLDRVQSIIVHEDGLVVVNTKEIYVQDERDQKWHDIGTFQITIGMHMPKYNTEQTVRIKNTKYFECHAGYAAPHVFNSGYMCHGNIESMMIEAYKNKNLYELVFIILQFLKSANTSDAAGQYVNFWPEVSEDVVKGIVHEKKEVKINIPIHIGERK